jgi:hypothetical protein
MGGIINLQRAVRNLALPTERRGPAHEIDGRAQNGVLVSPIISVNCENYLWTSGPKQPTGDA